MRSNWMLSLGSCFVSIIFFTFNSKRYPILTVFRQRLLRLLLLPLSELPLLHPLLLPHLLRLLLLLHDLLRRRQRLQLLVSPIDLHPARVLDHILLVRLLQDHVQFLPELAELRAAIFCDLDLQLLGTVFLYRRSGTIISASEMFKGMNFSSL